MCDILTYPHGGYTSNWSIWNPFFGLLVYIVWERDEDRHLFDQEVESAKFLICMQRWIFYDCMHHRGVLFPPNQHHEWSTFNFSNRFPAQLRSSRVNNTRTWLQIFGFNMIQHHPLFSLLHDSYFHFIRSVTDWGKPLVVQSISRLQKTQLSQKAMNQTGFLKRLRLIIAFQNYKGPFPFQRGKGWICLSRDSWYGEKKRTKKQRLRLLVKQFEFDGRMDFCHSKDEKCIKVKRPFLFKAWNLTLMSIVFNCQFFVQ